VIQKALNWHKPDVELPPEGKYVLVRHGQGNWHDETDQDNVNCVIAKMIHGISLEARASLLEGDHRKITHKAQDEGWNNEKDYAWFTFGALVFFGQDIVCWCHIPE